MNKTVFVSGRFNVLHIGHQRLLRFAKESGNRLIVGVESDLIAGKNAHINQELRLEGVRNNIYVDDVFIITDSVISCLEKLKPDIVVKGREHESKYNEEYEILKTYGGILLFNSGEASLSSLNLIRKEFLFKERSDILAPTEFMLRHKITQSRLLSTLSKFKDLNVCVIGDLIIDEYITCEPIGMSQEDPTIVVTPIDSTRFIGGAGIVAAHAKGLGGNIHFISVAGKDEMHEFANNYFNEMQISHKLFIDDTRPTTLKQRFRCKGKTLLRVSRLSQSSISKTIQDEIYRTIENLLPTICLFVFSDFNYGCLPQELVKRLIELFVKNNKIFVADSQSSSQHGDISRFKRAFLITPTEHEARLCIRSNDVGLVVLADALLAVAEAKHIFLKLGEEGVLISSSSNYDDLKIDRIGALNSNPKDVAGAGDSMLISSAMALATGTNIWEAACIGSYAAAIQVDRVGNSPIQMHELMRVIA
jgi:rfaE bifunctional protein kinase chain/domain